TRQGGIGDERRPEVDVSHTALLDCRDPPHAIVPVQREVLLEGSEGPGANPGRSPGRVRGSRADAYAHLRIIGPWRALITLTFRADATGCSQGTTWYRSIHATRPRATSSTRSSPSDRSCSGSTSSLRTCASRRPWTSCTSGSTSVRARMGSSARRVK